MTSVRDIRTSHNRLEGHIPTLDGLRGASCLFVVVHHCFIWPMLFAKGIVRPEAFHELYRSNWSLLLIWYGYSGVELFFLLSGFCLLYPVFSQPERTFSWRRYMWRRFRRIYPPYLGSLLLAVGLAWLGWAKINNHLHYATEPPTQNAILSSLTLTGSHYCLPFWSLVVEAQWYLFVPILAVLWKRSRVAMHVLIASAIVALSFVPPRIHVLTEFALFLPMFWAGICMAEIATTESSRIRHCLSQGGWLLLLLAGLALVHQWVQPPPVWMQTKSQTYPFAVLYLGIFAAVLFTRGGRYLMSGRWLVRLGTISYSLYLIHALVIYVAIVAFGHYRISNKSEMILCFTVLPALCIACGYLFYLCIEKWTLHFKIAGVTTRSGVEIVANPSPVNRMNPRSQLVMH